MSCVNTSASRCYIGLAYTVSYKSAQLPFLYLTKTIQRRSIHGCSSSTRQSPISTVGSGYSKAPQQRRVRKHTVSDQQGWSAYPRGNQYEFSNADTHVERNERGGSFQPAEQGPRSGRGRAGTLTDSERDSFAKLFRTLGAKAKPESQAEYDHDVGAFHPSLATDLADIHGGENLDKRLESILDREMRGEESKIKQYPDQIRGMAVMARLQLARNRLLRQQKMDQEGIVNKADEEIRRVWVLMDGAGSDMGVWHVLEEEVFGPFKSLNLDDHLQPTLQRKPQKLQGIQNDGATEPSEVFDGRESPDLALITRTYPHNLYNAARILSRRTIYTPLVSSILPACKALGLSSYVVGISTGLFNEVLQHTWRVLNDMSSMLSMLQEMDDAALTLDNGTWTILEKVTLYRFRALRGDFGEGLRLMEGMSARMKQGKSIWTWKYEIKQRIEQAALERTQGDGTPNDPVEDDEIDRAIPSPFSSPPSLSVAAA